jgi:hypothetical protein
VERFDGTNQRTVSIATVNTGLGYDIGHSEQLLKEDDESSVLLTTDRGYIKQEALCFGRSGQSSKPLEPAGVVPRYLTEIINSGLFIQKATR